MLYFWKGVALKSSKQIDDALLNFKLSIRHLSSVDFDEKNYSILCEAYRKATVILYHKKNYLASENIMLQMYSTYSKYKSNFEENSPNYQNGADSIMTLYELMLIQLKENDTIIIEDQQLKIRDIVTEITKNNIDNSIILKIFLDSIYDLIYNHKKDEIISEDKLNDVFEKINGVLKDIYKVIDDDKEKTDDKKSICLINYFYWEYEDFIKWIETIRDLPFKEKNEKKIFISNNADKLILLSQKAHDAQNEIRNKIFEESKSAAE